jgi:hypothetical protein
MLGVLTLLLQVTMHALFPPQYYYLIALLWACCCDDLDSRISVPRCHVSPRGENLKLVARAMI